jgi:hypothetical protein
VRLASSKVLRLPAFQNSIPGTALTRIEGAPLSRDAVRVPQSSGIGTGSALDYLTMPQDGHDNHDGHSWPRLKIRCVRYSHIRFGSQGRRTGVDTGFASGRSINEVQRRPTGTRCGRPLAEPT